MVAAGTETLVAHRAVTDVLIAHCLLAYRAYRHSRRRALDRSLTGERACHHGIAPTFGLNYESHGLPSGGVNDTLLHFDAALPPNVQNCCGYFENGLGFCSKDDVLRHPQANKLSVFRRSPPPPIQFFFRVTSGPPRDKGESVK